jgi:serine phosphatase RsbU (regulator of sigma subunit)
LKRNNTYFFLLLILCFCFFKQNAAPLSKLDSLENILKLSKEDTNKVKVYQQLFMQSNDSLIYLEQALKLSEKLDYKKGEASSLFFIGCHYYSNEKYDKALEYYLKSRELAETYGYKKLLANVYKFIGFIYRPKEPNTAVEYYAKSLKILTDLKDERSASYLLSAIGNVYEGTSGGKDNKQSALDYYLKSLEIRERIGRPAEVASSLNETSRMYEKLGQQNKASELRRKGLEIAEKAGSLENVVYLCNLIGLDFCRLNNFNKALQYQLRAYKIVSEKPINNYIIMSEVVHSLAYTYSKLKDYKKSTEYYSLYIACSDSVKARENNTNLINLEHTLVEEQEKQNLLIKDVEIEKQKVIVDKQIVLRNAFIGGFALVVALVVFIFRGYRQKQKANRELGITYQKIENAYKIIEEKTKAMTDSIHYALRIQRATLPHRSDIWEALKESFILYKPKDIVSGDFYWFFKKDKTILIAAVDCTGHGVPGAFMSIIGSERLNDAIHNENDPGKILSLLNQGIKSSLRQSENAESTRDGMDIALCSIDLNSNIINFAGANRPLWIIRKDRNETSGEHSRTIEEIKPTKISIGGLTKSDQQFKTQTVQLQKGDTFYIFSDGYTDQFGGSEGKKLMTKKFKKILLDIQDLTMHEQEKYLADTADRWKAGREQVDDILVIGVKM